MKTLKDVMIINNLSKYQSALIDDCRKFLGLAPYNTYNNIVVGDPFFYNSMCKKYGDKEVAYVVKVLQ